MAKLKTKAERMALIKKLAKNSVPKLVNTHGVAINHIIDHEPDDTLLDPHQYVDAHYGDQIRSTHHEDGDWG